MHKTSSPSGTGTSALTVFGCSCLGPWGAWTSGPGGTQTSSFGSADLRSWSELNFFESRTSEIFVGSLQSLVIVQRVIWGCLFSWQGSAVDAEHLSEMTEEEYELSYITPNMKGFIGFDTKYLIPFFTRRFTQKVSSKNEKIGCQEYLWQKCDSFLSYQFPSLIFWHESQKLMRIVVVFATIEWMTGIGEGRFVLCGIDDVDPILIERMLF